MNNTKNINLKIDMLTKVLEDGYVPSSFSILKTNSMGQDAWTNYETTAKFRNEYTEKYGFALIDLSWNKILVDNIIKDKKCLEVMAGTGLWSQALRELGVDIICTDDLSWENESHPQWKKHRTDIINLDAIEAIEKYGKDVSFILMSWPYMDDTAYECLLKMREVNPDAVLIYIGEGYGGCTASDIFFENANRIDNYDIDEVNEHFMSFYGIHDRIWLIQ